MGKHVKLGLIGAGRAGMIHALNFRSRIKHADLVAVVDPFEDAAKAACAELEIDKYYLDYKSEKIMLDKTYLEALHEASEIVKESLEVNYERIEENNKRTD